MTMAGFVLIPTPGSPGGWRFTPPAPRVVPINQPTKGAGVTVKLPSDRLCRIDSVCCKLTTSVTVSNRNVLVEALSSTSNLLWAVDSGANIPATKTMVLSWAIGLGATHAATANLVAALPNVLLPPNSTLSIVVSGVEATDQLATVCIVYELI
jgi:hypothetical protein